MKKKALLLLFLTLCFVWIASSNKTFKASAPSASDITDCKNYVSVCLNSLFNEIIYRNSFLQAYYAGSFIDRDGNYNICMTSENAVNDLKSLLPEDIINLAKEKALSEMDAPLCYFNAIKHLTVNYHIKAFSYNYLSQIILTLNNSAFELGITSMGIKQAENNVDIYLVSNNYAEKVLAYLYDSLPFFNSASVHFYEQSFGSAISTKTPYSGDRIYYNVLFFPVQGTIGFHAKNAAGTYGVVTNSHVAPLGTTMLYDGSTLGTPAYSTINGSIDAAFIPFVNTSSLSWQSTYKMKKYGESFYETIYSVASSSQIVEGARVKKYGIASLTNYGYITYTSMTCNYIVNGYTYSLTDCVQFDNISQSGDSGGPVGLVAPVGKAKFYLLAIAFASTTGSSGGFGCKVSNIVSAFGITPVTYLNP